MTDVVAARPVVQPGRHHQWLRTLAGSGVSITSDIGHALLVLGLLGDVIVVDHDNAVDEARRFLESAYADRDPLYPLWVLILVLGLRKGEAQGLVWPAIDLRILRHTKFAITMEIYTQVPDQATQDALRRLSDALGDAGADLPDDDE